MSERVDRLQELLEDALALRAAMKRAAGRPKDLEAIAELEATS